MSLKAKIEAVIYASDEPVTLPQLVSLLGLEAQDDLDALDARQGSLLPLDLPAFTGVPGFAEAAEPDTLDAQAPDAETPAISAGEGVASPEAAFPHPASPEPASPKPASPEPAAETAPHEASSRSQSTLNEAQQKREARERERRLREYFRGVLDELAADYTQGDRGLEIREVAGGFRFATKPEFHDTVRGFVRSLKPPLKLSLQALETLAVVAYKQPVTAPEVSEIRGVDSGGVLGSLLSRKLVTTAGRKQVIGRPILYKTTKEFLLRFGLKDTSELPSIEEFERLAGELNEAVQEEIDMEQDSDQRLSGEPVERAPSPATGDSPALDEINVAPSPQQPLHPEVEDLIADKSSSPAPNGSEAAEGQSRGSAGDETPMAEIHEAQADGTPENTV